ncbi:hypothetical protein ABZ714_06215 [Streptomyces sp. NPDC006798]|uniref:SCO4402 family protein n=1 Tax=Streptomyces sp. NPDC006798 TaxID=3155462 RepID=UPI0033BFDF5C
MEFPEKVNVEFPSLRLQVLDGLEALADVNYQRRVWVDRNLNPGELLYDLTMAVNALDDVRALDHPEEEVGSIFRTEKEATAMLRVSAILVPLIEKLGESPDVTYINSPEWPGVVEAATAALLALNE